jgi:hypothetical protein
MVHNSFTLDGGKLGQRVIVVWGTRQSSPFKEMSRTATIPLRVPMPRRGKLEMMVLTLEEFLEGGQNFNLEGGKGDQTLSTFSLKSKSFWIHPTTFIVFIVASRCVVNVQPQEGRFLEILEKKCCHIMPTIYLLT